MYLFLKRIGKTLLPNSWMIRNESLIRKSLFFLYKGKEKGCNVCHKSFKQFITLPSQDQKCPYCGSIDRNRRVWHVLEKDHLHQKKKILHFSPSRPIYRALKKSEAHYTSTDFEGEFLADKQLDITRISEANQSFDLIICYHVLEHITEDKKALAELYRILKNDGQCLVQTPFKKGELYEDFSITTRHERLQHFGQEDHVRIYSAEALKQRAEAVGFLVAQSDFKEETDNYYGFKEEETILILSKPSLGQ